MFDQPDDGETSTTFMDSTLLEDKVDRRTFEKSMHTRQHSVEKKHDSSETMRRAVNKLQEESV